MVTVFFSVFGKVKWILSVFPPLSPFPLSNQISLLYKFHYGYLIFYIIIIIIIIIIILFNYISTTNIITGKIVEKNSYSR